MDPEFEIIGRLKDEDDRAAEPEAADLVSGLQGLTAEEGGRLGVRRFAEGTRGDGAEGRVGAEGLRSESISTRAGEEGGQDARCQS